MNTPLSSIGLVLTASFIGSFGAVFLKAGAGRTNCIKSLLFNPRLALGVCLFLISTASPLTATAAASARSSAVTESFRTPTTASAMSDEVDPHTTLLRTPSGRPSRAGGAATTGVRVAAAWMTLVRMPAPVRTGTTTTARRQPSRVFGRGPG